jgi:DNA-binding CsgD family transcriptional regulator/tetratricopeptide (TPR) repeat protein
MTQPGLVRLGASDLPLVGREPEVATTVGLIDRVEDGFGQAVLVTGPTGIGKTRFVEEVVRLAEARGVQALHGSARPVDRILAYAPILQAVGGALRTFDPPERTKQLRGLESLSLVLEDLGLPSPPPLSDPALERTRLFHAMVRLLDRLAKVRPVLLVLEDLQWADEASLDLVGYLTRELSSLRMLMMLTCSTEDLDGHSPVSRLLADLRREGSVTEIQLGPLRTSEVASLVEAALGGIAQSLDVDALAARTAGTPLLLLALLDELMRLGGLIPVEGRLVLVEEIDRLVPRVAADIFASRLATLDPKGREVLEIVAAGGDSVPHGELRAVAQLEESELIESVESLTSAGLMVVEDRAGDVTYRCAHPLLADVIYEHTPAAIRTQLHGRFVEILESANEEVGSRLLWHYQRAGPNIDQKRRLLLLAGSGRQALESYANKSAIELLGVALSVARSAGRLDLVPDLLEDLGEALSRVGEEHAASEMWMEASALVNGENAISRLHRRLAAAESNLGHFEAARDHVAAGLEKLSGSTGAELLELYAVDTLNSFRQGGLAAAATGVETFTELAADTGSSRAEMTATMFQAGLALEQASYVEAQERAARALKLAQVGGDPVAQQQALCFLALVDVSLGDLAALDERLKANLVLTEQIGIALREYRIRLYEFAGHVYAGRWDQADEVAVNAAVLVRRIESSRNQAVLTAMPALLDVFRGDFERAGERLEKTRRRLGELDHPEPRLHVMLEILDAWSALEAGRPENALATLEALEGDSLLGLLPPWGMMVLGEAQARMGDARWATTATRLSQLGPPTSLPAVWALRVEALATGDRVNASELWAAAESGFANLSMPFESARARLELAELSDVLGSEAATELADGCHDVFTRLGAARYRHRAARTLRSLGRVPAPGEASAGALSRRQAEVARLVAEGLTNTEIAERLYISRRTVTTHLENIYRQLGISSRIALTRYVIEENPASDQPG